VDGWFELHGRFGKLAMKDILQPTIDYARNGHPVHETVQHYWNLSTPRLSEYPGFAEQMTIDGRAPEVGEIWKNPNLANTLESIANNGRDAFYKGDMARVIGEFMQANGGFLSYEDLASHHSSWVEPVSINYRGYRPANPQYHGAARRCLHGVRFGGLHSPFPGSQETRVRGPRPFLCRS
jgi:gamma-glutamyltranspeptidase/glutathione hydrolase